MVKISKRILIVEDDTIISDNIKLFLENHGYKIHQEKTAQSAIDNLTQNYYDCVLLDLGLPDFSGFEVLKWATTNTEIPVIITSAEIDEQDVVKGLRLGAKDYVRKPFGLKELLARIEVTMLKEKTISMLSFNQKGLYIDFITQTTYLNHEEVKLTNNEFRLLKLMSTHPHKVFSREQLILGAFGHQYESYERTIDTYIKTLRAKIEKDPKKPSFIQTVFAVGYQFIGDQDEI